MNPTTGIAACCARAVSGHVTTALLKSLMNSRRLMGFTPLAENHLRKSLIRSSSESYAPHRSKKSCTDVRYGSKADISACPINVCFTPKSGHWNSVAKCPLCADFVAEVGD